MANSADVNAGDQALASQYNNLRADVLNTSTGHTHDGADSKSLATDAVSGAIIADGGVGANKLATSASYNGTITVRRSYAGSTFFGISASDEADAQRDELTGRLRNSDAGFASAKFMRGIEDIPENATITTVILQYSRTEGTLNHWLYNRDPSGGSLTTVSSISADDTSGSPVEKSNSISVSPSYNDLVWWMVVQIDNVDATDDQTLWGIEIVYTIPAPAQ